MSLNRKVVKSESYLGRNLEARFMGPDLLAFCDGMELGNFYVDVEAALASGRRYVEADQKAKAEAKAKNERVK